MSDKSETAKAKIILSVDALIYFHIKQALTTNGL